MKDTPIQVPQKCCKRRYLLLVAGSLLLADPETSSQEPACDEPFGCKPFDPELTTEGLSRVETRSQ
jgi:hypothetical protein